MKFEEQNIQKACVKWFRLQHPELILYANYNNAHNATQGGINKAMGVTSGVPDLTYIDPENGFIYIEVKTPKSTVSAAQKQFLKRADYFYNVPCYIVRSLDDFIDLIEAIHTDDFIHAQKYKYKP